MSHRYDVYYQGRSYDRCVPLPEPSPAIVRAVNQDWDGHVLVPYRGYDPDLTEWDGAIYRAALDYFDEPYDGDEAAFCQRLGLDATDLAAFADLFRGMAASGREYPTCWWNGTADQWQHLAQEDGMHIRLTRGWVDLGRPPAPEYGWHWRQVGA